MKAAYLIGFRGAGKSTLGAAVARELGARFLDLDVILERKLGQSTPDWILAHGEPAFRAEEALALRKIEQALKTDRGASIVALGGGIVEGAASLALLEQSAVPKIYLSVPPAELWARLSKDPARLRVGGLSSLNELQNLWEKRRPLFEKISTKRVENCDINESISELKRELAAGWGLPL
jgi:shikimate kinase